MGSGAQPQKQVLDPGQPAHPAILLLATPDGSLRPEFHEWAEDWTYELDEGTLLPAWWPLKHPEDGHTLSHEERVGAFRENLESVLPNPRKRTTTPEDVLKALLFLRTVCGPR